MAIRYTDTKYVKGKGYTDAKSGKVVQKASNTQSKSSSSPKSTSPAYDKSTNYSKLIEDLISGGNYNQSALDKLIEARNAKIKAEGMANNVVSSNDLVNSFVDLNQTPVGKGKLGNQIVNNIAGKVKVGKTFDEVMPWETYYNETAQRDKVTQDYMPEHNQRVDLTTKAKISDRSTLLNTLGSRGLSGAGGTALYKQRLLDDEYRRKFDELEKKKKDDIALTMQRIYNDTLSTYNTKKADYNKQNYITY